ncbi:MAG: endonuclease/exonuclease/phosphatase family protein [Cyclobacteriaceae bacterium]|nr:endonuclease/exonuclease/phosphatase family protein [Cyclobacteriaceae bacterium]
MAATSWLQAQSLKVMSYNIRYDNGGDGINQWSNRKEKVAKIIRENNPDLIGLQEALDHQLKELLVLLPDYTSYGVGRDDGKEKGEFSAILVRHSRFGVIKDSTFWLSETPDIAGSKGWDAQLPRVATWTELYDRDNKKEILYINTHFDHVGKQARTNSAILINDFLADHYKKKNLVLVMSGDLNVERDTEAFKVLTETKLMLDSKPEDDHHPTFCGFEVSNTKCVAIDYIFHSKEAYVKSYYVLRDNDGKNYPSDHLPVIAELEFIEKN